MVRETDRSEMTLIMLTEPLNSKQLRLLLEPKNTKIGVLVSLRLFISQFCTVDILSIGAPYTLQSPYNTVRYNTVLDITRFKDGSQKYIDYIEK